MKGNAAKSLGAMVIVGIATELAAPMLAAPVNVALGKPVALVGTFGNSTAATPFGWEDPAPGPASLITDGIFNTDQRHWQEESIWWHEYDTLDRRFIVIDLLDTFHITGVIVQSDNNDTYPLEYLDTADIWQPLSIVAESCCWGVATRPNRLDNTEVLGIGTVMARAVRISGAGGDLYYSVTEVQVFREPVRDDVIPEPSAWVLMGTGAATLVVMRSRVRYKSDCCVVSRASERFVWS